MYNAVILLLCIAICKKNVENVETDCYDSERCTKCKNNYAPPTCCDCADGYRKTQSGQCCPENTIEISGTCTREYITLFYSADEER